MHQSQKAILFVLSAVFLVALGHRLRAGRTVVAADRYEAAAQKMRPFLKAGSRMNLTGNLSGTETLLPCRNAFFPVLLFPEEELRLDTVLWIHARSNSLPAGRYDTSDAQKILCRHQDDSNLYVLMIRPPIAS